MKVVQINTVCTASTGKIAVEISKLLDKSDIENYIFYTSGHSDFKNARKYATDLEVKANALFSKIRGNYGFNSKGMTKRLIRELDKMKPDAVQLHNLHGHNVNLSMLFAYLKEKNIRVFWTFHDCWSFTGYCTNFDGVACNKWKTSCNACIQRKSFSWFWDKSIRLYKKKKALIEGLNLTVITPSAWLSDLVKQSIFGKHPIHVIPSGIDLTLFKPTESDFREKYGLGDKKIWLGVAMGFDERKGYPYYLEIAKKLPENTYLVMVGVNKEQIDALPSNIVGIERTANQKELAEIYSAADVFVNCTMEEILGMVNIEALACGTPVVTFRTGGSPECIDETCGRVVPQGDVDALIKAAEELQVKDISGACRKRVETYYRAEQSFAAYVNLYKG